MENCICKEFWPDLIICGGDTEPWQFSLIHENGKPYTLEELETCRCVLDILPLSSTHYHRDEPDDQVVLTKDGKITTDEDGCASVVFEFLAGDTFNMRGAYIYQTSFYINNIALRVQQGRLTVLPNVNRGAL